MQRDLDALMDWGSTWGMKFNAKKCNIMRVSRSRKPLQNFYSLGNEILQEVCKCRPTASIIRAIALLDMLCFSRHLVLFIDTVYI